MSFGKRSTLFLAAMLVWALSWRGGPALADRADAPGDGLAVRSAADDKTEPAKKADPKTGDKADPKTDAKPEKSAEPKAIPTPAKPDSKPEPKPEAVKVESKSDIPSPAELMRKLREEKERKAKMARVVFFDLAEPVNEAPPGFSLFGSDRLTVRTLIDHIRTAGADKNVKGILMTLGDSGLNASQAQEVRDALIAFRKSGKPVFVHADSYDTRSYIVASGASDICLLEGGEIMIPGVGMEAMFAKGLLDKIGIKADYVQIGEFKGADEELTRTEASKELRGEMTKLTEAMYGQIVDTIAEARKLPKEVVKQSIDETILTGPTAKSRGFVDHLIDQDGLRELMGRKLGNEVDLMKDYGRVPREALDFSSPIGLVQALMKKPEPPENPKPAVALIYAEGIITDGEAGGDILGLSEEGIGSENMRVALRLALRDENIKAIVIRIDSPGGSALASEVMWQAVRRAAAKKPVIISVGSMAASGGYYLACAGDKIYADPTAIVGSIGVVGKMVFKELFEKLGLKTETFAKGRNAGMWSSSEPWSERQREMVKTWMKGTYDQFTDRVMTTRKGKIKDIDQVARGRIFLATQAKELGMVDEIGGINAAVADAARRGGLKTGEYDVNVLPRPKTLADYLNGTASDKDAAFPFQPKIEIKADGLPLMKALSPSMRKALGRQLQMIQLLQDRPVILAAPYTLMVK